MTIRADVLLDISGNGVSVGRHLIQSQIPATLIQRGLVSAEIMKLEVSHDNGELWIQANDGAGVQFNATGKNIFPITAPMLFRINKTGFSALTISSVVTGTGATARFTYTAGPVFFVGQKITVSGFSGGNVGYNKTGIITLTTATTFEMVDVDTGVPIAFVGDGTGSAQSFSVCTLSYTASA